MRLIFILFFTAQLAIQCQENKVPDDKLNVILQFLDEEAIPKKDYRMYVPPPPPELRDSTYHPWKMRPDSIVKNLEPLKIYVNDSIRSYPNFKFKRELPKGYNFVKDISLSSIISMALDIRSLPDRKGIVLQSINFGEFKKILPSIQHQDEYGGLITFQNLFFSKDGKKAYFEVHFFKGKLNASTSAVFANWKDGKWEYTEQVLSIS